MEKVKMRRNILRDITMSSPIVSVGDILWGCYVTGDRRFYQVRKVTKAKLKVQRIPSRGQKKIAVTGPGTEAKYGPEITRRGWYLEERPISRETDQPLHWATWSEKHSSWMIQGMLVKVWSEEDRVLHHAVASYDPPVREEVCL